MKKGIVFLYLLFGLVSLAVSQITDLSTDPQSATVIKPGTHVEFTEFYLNPQANVELIQPAGIDRAYFNQNYYFRFIMPETYDVNAFIQFSGDAVAGMAAYTEENGILYPLDMTFVHSSPGLFSINQIEADAGLEIIVRLWFDQDMSGNTIQLALKKEDPVLQTKAIIVDPNAYTPQQLVEDILITGCLQATDVTYTGSSEAIGYFMGNIGDSGFDEGFVMTSGEAVIAQGPDVSTSSGNSNSGGSDPDLAALIPGYSIYDAAVLEFDFIPASDTLLFEYIFGSEEFPEFANLGYNDAFGFFLSGPGISGPYSNNAVNIALLPDGTPVTIDNLYNSGVYYVGSPSGSGGEGLAYNNTIEYDGASIPLTAMAIVQSCETYHIKLAIGDAGDGSWDSGVFFKAGSFTSGASYTAMAFNPWNASDILYEGCTTQLIFTRTDQDNLDEQIPIPMTVGGTATMGIDFTNVPDTFYIQSGHVSDTLFVDGVIDGVPEGPEVISFSFLDGCPCEANTITIEIDLLDQIEWEPTLTNPGPICLGETVTIDLNLPAGVDLALADWVWTEDNSTGYSITVTPDVTTTYGLEWTHPCTTFVVNTTIEVIPPPDIDLGPDFVVFGYDTPLDAGMEPGNTGNWEVISGPGPATFGNNTESETTVTVDSLGIYGFVWHEVSLAPDCIDSDTLFIEFYEMVYDTTYQNVTCYGGDDGSAQIIVSGGVEPYTYVWSNEDSVSNLTGLEAGVYSVIVYDALGGTVSETFTITQPDPLVLSFNEDAQICEGQSVSLMAIVNGGTLPYTYYWSSGGAYTVGPESMMVSPNSTTNYSVYVVDAHGCQSVVLDMDIVVSEAIHLSLDIADNTCHDACDGEVEMTIYGGLPPFDFSWASDNRILEDVCAGLYDVTIVDQIGCIADTVFFVDEPSEVLITTYSDPASCPGIEDGLAWVEAFGGVPPYNYIWGNGSVNDSVWVSGGTYTLTVEDSHNCRKVTEVVVDAPQAMEIVPDHVPAICIGGTAQLGAEVMGGSDPYTYAWMGEDGTTGFDHIFNVEPRVDTDYSLTITDDHGCQAYQDFTVRVKPPLQINSVSLNQDTVCANSAIRLFVDVEGGNGGPYTLQLQDGQVIPSPFTLYPQESQMWYITLSDDCETPAVSDSIYIPVWPIPENAFVSDKVHGCPPLNVAFNEIHPDEEGYTYSWAYGDNEFGVSKFTTHRYDESGLYSVSLSVKAPNGCVNTKVITDMIEVFPKPMVDFYTTPNEASIMNPQIQFTAIPENADSLFWYFGDGDSAIWQVTEPVHFYAAKGEYGVSLVGENSYGCTDTAYKVIRITDQPTFWAPNGFSPNGDGENDCFRICGNGIDPNEFYLAVFNRWGEMVYETEIYDTDAECDECGEGAWDGTYFGKRFEGDEYLAPGIYTWYSKFKDSFGNWNEHNGFIRLAR